MASFYLFLNKYREVPTIDLVGQIEFDAVPDFLDSCDILFTQEIVL